MTFSAIFLGRPGRKRKAKHQRFYRDGGMWAEMDALAEMIEKDPTRRQQKKK